VTPRVGCSDVTKARRGNHAGAPSEFGVGLPRAYQLFRDFFTARFFAAMAFFFRFTEGFS
jgi:hypothetical protein